MRARTSLILTGLVLALGLALLTVRYWTLAALRVRARPTETPQITVSRSAPESVPVSLLRLRGENQALRQSLEAASNHLAIESQTWSFDPGASVSRSAQLELIEDLRRLGEGREHQEAAGLGRALAAYLERNEGRLPESLEFLQGSGIDAASALGRRFELLHREPIPPALRTLRFIAQSEDVPLAGGRTARFFLKGDGGVVIATVEDPSDWTTWVAEQEARDDATLNP